MVSNNTPPNVGTFPAGRSEDLCPPACADYFVAVGDLNNDGEAPGLAGPGAAGVLRLIDLIRGVDDGYAVWRRILLAVKELQWTEPQPGERAN